MSDDPNINFIILSPDPNIGRLKGTVRSIKNNYKQDANIICSVAKTVKKSEIEEMKEVCPTFKGGDTITSLINNGMKNSSDGWAFLIFEGAWLPKNIKSRYFKWIKSEKDILFPIVVSYGRDGKIIKVLANFPECTLNGILLKKEFFKEIGKLSENPLQISKEFWAIDALEKGAEFKAILGVKIC